MKKSKNKRFFSLILIALFCCAFQTIVYSAINGTMTIKGDAYARVETDVRITGLRLSSVNNATSSYEVFGKNHIVTEVNLTNSSSSITYYLEITNYGSTDVGIFDITGLPSGVTYTIKGYNLHDKICDDSGKCNSFIKKTYELTLKSNSSYTGSIQLNFDFRTYHKVTYTDIPTTANYYYPSYVIDGGTLSILFKETLSNVYILSGGVEINHYDEISYYQTITIPNVHDDIEVKQEKIVAKLVSGGINKVGSEVCIGKECFYIISNDGSTVSMLAKYNLYIGGDYNWNTRVYTVYGEEATGRQDSTKIGFDYNDNISKGIIAFSDSHYWESYTYQFPSYIYNSNSNVYKYVENYRKYIEDLGIPVKNARIINYEEISNLGCTMQSDSCTYDWVSSTTYWSGEAVDDMGYIYALYKTSFFNGLIDFSYGSMYSGVRPVIEMSVDDIEVPPPAKVVSGDYDTIGSEVCISDECFYVISSTADTVTMLAKYNLYIGGDYNWNTGVYTVYGEEATGKQDSTMIGYDYNDNISKGIIAFSDSYYWESYTYQFPSYIYNSNSNVYKYVENYRKYIEDLGITMKNARLINYEEISNLGCTWQNDSCTYDWVSSTTYWSGEAVDDSGYIYVLYKTSFFNGLIDFSYGSMYSGVRPIIVIDKSNF